MRIFKDYVLMHKDISLCYLEINENGNLEKIRRIEKNAAHFPLGGQMNENKFHEWWLDRAIPKSRHGCKNALQKLGYSSTGNALVDNLALSLTDCYWIKPRDLSITWKDVNLFTNDFVDTFGELTIDEDYQIADLKEHTRFSPASSQGELQKKWCIDNQGRRFLIKGNYGNSYQQSINEVFASSMFNKIGINALNYGFASIKTNLGMGLGCRSYDFCSEDVEMITAWELLQTGKIKPGSYYYPFKETCLKMGVEEKEFDDFIDKMILSDYLITNVDRHMNNIAILRNPDTLQFIGFAPLYDFGNSMFYNLNYEQLQHVDLNKIKTHSFITWENDLLKYVKNKNAINLDKLEPNWNLYNNDIVENKERYPMIKEIFNKKIILLKDFQNQ